MVLDQSAGYSEAPGRMLSFPVRAGVRIFNGALVGLEGTGTFDSLAQNWSDDTGSNDVFVGIARITAEPGVETPEGESVIGNTGRTVEVSVDTSGPILRQVFVLNSSTNSTGDQVFATDENSFQVAPTPQGRPIGWVTRFHGNQICDVQLFPAAAWRIAQAI